MAYTWFSPPWRFSGRKVVHVKLRSIRFLVPTLFMTAGATACFVAMTPSRSGAALRAAGVSEARISVQPTHIGGAGQPFRILCGMMGSYAPDVVGNAVVRLGANLQWISGDTLHTASVSRNGDTSGNYLWNVDARAVADGTTEIRAIITVGPSPGRIDETEVVLPVLVNDGVVTFGQQRPVREETVRGNQRYRYAGEYLVPIDRSEFVVNSDIEAKVMVTRKVQATCRTCPADSIRELSFVVFVKRDGSIHSARFINDGSPDKAAPPDMIEAGRLAVMRWQFAPSKARSGPVADWIFVRVPVRGEAPAR